MASWQTRLWVLLLSGASFGSIGMLAAQDAAAPEPGEIAVRHLDKDKTPVKDPMLGISVQSMDVDADIQGLNARTTTTYIFKNDSDKQAECTFTFPLPENAAVDRFAMTINDKDMLEGTAIYSGDAEAIYKDLVAGNDGTCTAKEKLPGKITMIANLGGGGGGVAAMGGPRLVPSASHAPTLMQQQLHTPLTAPIMAAQPSHAAPMTADKYGTHVNPASQRVDTPYEYRGVTYQVGFGASHPVFGPDGVNSLTVKPRYVAPTPYPVPHKDPGVLERVGADLYRATVFAVEPHKTKTVVVSCVHPLAVNRLSPASSETVYRIPFMGLGGLVPAPRVTLHSVLRNPAADATVTASLDSKVKRQGGDMLIATEVQKPSDRMAWTIAVATPAAEVLNKNGCAVQAFRPEKTAPGYFALTVLPTSGMEDTRRPMDTIFVVDCTLAVSDSDRKMRHEFFDTVLASFTPDDRFAVVAVGAHPQELPHGLQAVDGTSTDQIGCLLDGLESNSQPDLRAGFECLRDLCQAQLDRRVNVVFLGTAAAESASPADVHAQIRAVLASRNAELFAVRMGSQLATDPLLTAARDVKELSQLSGAPVTELAPGVNAVDVAKRFAARLQNPVLRDAVLEVTTADGQTASQANPIQGGLMFGESSTFYGTYAKEGAARAVLTGTLNGAPYLREWTIDLPTEEKTHAALAKLWTRAQPELGPDAVSPNVDLYLSAIHNQVVNRNVAFLVLDGENRYKQLNIARPADGFHVAPLSPDVAGAIRPEDEVIGERK